MVNVRESARERLFPSAFSPRRYYLNQLRKELERIIITHIKKADCECLIDFGCGNEPYRSLFSPFVKNYLGADISLNDKSELNIRDDGTITVNDNTADIVLSTQVLEHVEDPVKYITEVKRILKNNGFFILTTHGYWIYHPDPADYWRWTSAGLQKIVSDAGMEIVSFRGILSRSAMGLQLFHDGLYFKMPVFVRSIFTFFMQYFIAFFDKIERQVNKDRDASTYIIIAKLNKSK